MFSWDFRCIFPAAFGYTGFESRKEISTGDKDLAVTCVVTCVGECRWDSSMEIVRDLRNVEKWGESFRELFTCKDQEEERRQRGLRKSGLEGKIWYFIEWSPRNHERKKFPRKQMSRDGWKSECRENKHRLFFQDVWLWKQFVTYKWQTPADLHSIGCYVSSVKNP